MIIAQQSVLFACTQGVDKNVVSLVGRYRGAVVEDTSTGAVGLTTYDIDSNPIAPTYSLRVLPNEGDVGVDVYASGATMANPTASGPYPTGLANTFCTPATLAGYYVAP